MVRASGANSDMQQNCCVCAQSAQWIEKQLTFPVLVCIGKVIIIWEYSDDTECCSGVAYMPKPVIVHLPCKTKASKHSHALCNRKTSVTPHSPYRLSTSETKACSTSLDLAMPQYDTLVTFYAVTISMVHISGSTKIRYLQNGKWLSFLLLSWPEDNMRNFPFPTYKVDSLLEELDLNLKHE